MNQVLLITLATVGAATAALRYAVPRRRFPAAPAVVALIGVVAMVGGVWLAEFASTRVATAYAKREWPAVSGVVTKSTVTGEDSYAPEVDYRFVIDSVTYTGTSDRHVPFFGNRRRTLEVAQKEVASLKPGTTVTVFYNPLDPTDNTIQPEPRWNDLAQSGLGVFLFAGGLFMVLWPRRKKS